MRMKLHNYYRSSASFRVRIAMALKGLDYEYLAIHLARGEHRLPEYAALSADRLVPLLEVDDVRLSQSMAIIEYLDETFPDPALLPADALGRAQVRGLAQTVACEIHPVNNLRVLKYLSNVLKLDEGAKNRWYCHWVRDGLEGFERQLIQLDQQRRQAGLVSSRFCFGDSPSLADCCLVPQIFNAQRFDCDLSGLPLTMAAFEACMQLPAFQQAQPANCPDFEP